MSRKLRHIRAGGAPVEITCRTINSLFLLRPCGLLNAIIVGALARAKALYPVELSAFAFASNHFHLLVWVETIRDLARFMNHFGRIRQRSGPLWARRYAGIVVSDEPEVQWDRLRYLLSHSVKEGMCESLMDWPGVHCARALVHGEKLEGYWFNRSKEWVARNQGKDIGYYDFATSVLRTSARPPIGVNCSF